MVVIGENFLEEVATSSEYGPVSLDLLAILTGQGDISEVVLPPQELEGGGGGGLVVRPRQVHQLRRHPRCLASGK